jgi:hypothetical protein
LPSIEQDSKEMRRVSPPSYGGVPVRHIRPQFPPMGDEYDAGGLADGADKFNEVSPPPSCVGRISWVAKIIIGGGRWIFFEQAGNRAKRGWNDGRVSAVHPGGERYVVCSTYHSA